MAQFSNVEDEIKPGVAIPAASLSVSIVMASYGRLQLLCGSLASALAQDYPDFEVLIVDDGSDEETKNWLCKSAQESKLLRVVLQDHQGVAVARARGVEEAQGDLICILDSDDTLEPYALRHMVRELEREPQRAIVYTNIRELKPSGERKVHEYPAFVTSRNMLWATLLSPRVPFKHSGTLFRRKIAIELGSYDRALPCKIDIDLYLKFLSAGYTPLLIREPLVNFRMHRDSISRDRVLGLSVWFHLIDRYGPSSLVLRLLLKGLRTASEAFKWLYMATAFRISTDS